MFRFGLVNRTIATRAQAGGVQWSRALSSWEPLRQSRCVALGVWKLFLVQVDFWLRLTGLCQLGIELFCSPIAQQASRGFTPCVCAWFACESACAVRSKLWTQLTGLVCACAESPASWAAFAALVTWSGESARHSCGYSAAIFASQGNSWGPCAWAIDRALESRAQTGGACLPSIKSCLRACWIGRPLARCLRCSWWSMLSHWIRQSSVDYIIICCAQLAWRIRFHWQCPKSQSLDRTLYERNFLLCYFCKLEHLHVGVSRISAEKFRLRDFFTIFIFTITSYLLKIMMKEAEGSHVLLIR